ncbi:MAG: chemotaxis protein CheD [Gemmatimonadales bacterium]|nr:chemotaxis protein CheD [Gemmatimonadales bacterium]
MTQLMENPSRLLAKQKSVIVDISDLKISNNPEHVIVTYSLGSCVGLTLYDPVIRVGGMIHCMLPLSKIDKAKAALKPYMFVDTGLAAMLGELYSMGAQRKNLIAKLAGAGSPLGRDETFKIGQRNYTILRKFLWKNNILIDAEDVGGSKARTLYLYMEDGRTIVKSEGKAVEL